VGTIPFLALPVLSAVLAYVLRRWRNVLPFIAVGVPLVLGTALIVIPYGHSVTLLGREVLLDEAAVLFGRELVLGPSARAAMAFLFLAGAGFFLLAWQLEPEGLFIPTGLGLLGLLGGVLVARPLIYAALLLQIAAVLAIFPLHSDPRLPTRGGLRYLTFFTLALPGLLISHWLLDMYALTPDQTGFLYTATALIGFSFVMMLGVVPFHLWVPAVGRDGVPLASAFLFSVLGGAVWFLFLDYLQTYPWLSSSLWWSSALTAIGVATAVVGGLLGMARRGPGRLMGYAVMVDSGMMLVALAQSSRAGLNLGLVIVFSRVFGAALMAAGLTGLRARSGEGDVGMAGLGRRAPWSTLALLVGGLSLAGFPPVVGFVSRWGLYRLLFRARPLTALTLLLASAGLLVGLLRLLYQLLERPPRLVVWEDEEREELPEAVPESSAVVALLLLFILAALALGLFPQWLTTVAARVGTAFTFFGP